MKKPGLIMFLPFLLILASCSDQLHVVYSYSGTIAADTKNMKISMEVLSDTTISGNINFAGQSYSLAGTANFADYTFTLETTIDGTLMFIEGGISATLVSGNVFTDNFLNRSIDNPVYIGTMSGLPGSDAQTFLGTYGLTGYDGADDSAVYKGTYNLTVNGNAATVTWSNNPLTNDGASCAGYASGTVNGNTITLTHHIFSPEYTSGLFGQDSNDTMLIVNQFTGSLLINLDDTDFQVKGGTAMEIFVYDSTGTYLQTDNVSTVVYGKLVD